MGTCRLTPELHREIAQKLYEAEKSVSYIPLLSETYPEITQEDAYTIQKEGLKLRLQDGHIVVGRKIGITSRGMMDLLNVDTPDYGYLLDTGLVMEGTACKRSEFNVPILEGEIAFIMGEDLSGPGVTVADIMNATAWVVPCFEVCDARYQNWKATVRDTISDDAGASKFVLGSQPKRLCEINPKCIGMVIEKNGELIGTGTGAEAMGSPLNTMMWLANKLAEFGDCLKKGNIVLSGALMAAVPCEVGDNFCLSVDGFPPTTLKFV